MTPDLADQGTALAAEAALELAEEPVVTACFPRSMEQAFGPYARRELSAMGERGGQSARRAFVVSAVVTAVVVMSALSAADVI